MQKQEKMKLTNKIIRWTVTSKLLIPLRKLLNYAISAEHGIIVYYSDSERLKVFDLIKKIKTETEMAMKDNEAYQIFMAVKRTKKIEGDIVEVGAYKGGSAKLICEAKENKILHLFDTFEGLPDVTKIDNPRQFYKGKYLGTLNEVKETLSKYPEVNFYKGIFPSTSKPIENKMFSFVHLDVDLYKSTLDSIKFFYPRMNKGGVIISHDYFGSPVVKKAFDDFFKDKPEPIIEMSGTQCLIVKTG